MQASKQTNKANKTYIKQPEMFIPIQKPFEAAVLHREMWGCSSRPSQKMIITKNLGIKQGKPPKAVAAPRRSRIKKGRQRRPEKRKRKSKDPPP